MNRDHQKALRLRNEFLRVSQKPWNEVIKEKLIDNFTYHSTKIEGLKLNYGDTLNYFRKGIIRDHENLKDITDLKNHKQVLKRIFDSYQKLNLDTQTIKELHAELMRDPIQWNVRNAYSGGPGEFKRENNYGFRGANATKEYLDWMEVPKALRTLCKETAEQLENEEQVIGAIHTFHFEFANYIHPFGDGNGRMVRLLHNLLLMKAGFPVVIIKSEEKKKYIQSIIEQEENPKEKKFDRFMTDKLINALEKRISQSKKHP